MAPVVAPAAGAPAWTPPDTVDDEPDRAAPPGTGHAAYAETVGPTVAAAATAGLAAYARAIARRPGRPPVVPLRPLVLGDILDGAVTLVRRHPASTIGTGVVVALLTQLAAFGLSLTTLGRSGTSTAADGSTTTDGGTALLSLVSGEVTLVVRSLGVLLLVAFAASALRREVLGLPGRFTDVWGDVRPRAARVLLAALLGSLAVLGCTLTQLGTPAAVFLYVSWSLAPAVVVLEGAGAWHGLGRSMRLVRGAWWRVLGVLLLTLLVSSVVGLVVGIPFGLLSRGIHLFDSSHRQTVPDLALASAGGALAGALTIPFTAAVHAVLYLDQRMRVEAFDVALAQGRLDATAMTTG